MVVEHSGSVPGITGTHLIVSDKGIVGTVGGGAAEKELVDHALAHRNGPEIRRFHHTPKEGGTLCSGVQVFAVVPLTEKDLAQIDTLVETLDRHETGMIEVSSSGVGFTAGGPRPYSFVEHDGSWKFSYPMGLLDTLYVVGGGHVSLALSRVMATLPFRIVILDNRPDLETMGTNRYAHELRVIDFDSIGDHVEAGPRSWAVIMTFGHQHDRRVLEGLIGKPLAYLGLMGSEAKVRRLFADMRADNIPAEALQTVRAPIGMSIGSHTPEEIAISIAGEIIAVRNGRDGPCRRSASS
jgi:xanthine dehydrogenase accessory factor